MSAADTAWRRPLRPPRPRIRAASFFLTCYTIFLATLAKILGVTVPEAMGLDVPWGKTNKLTVKYTLDRLKSDIKTHNVRLSASAPP